MKKILLISACFLIYRYSFAQKFPDSIKPKELQKVMITSWIKRDIDRLPEVQNNIISLGKKSEVINIGSTNANVALKTVRQLFAKIPGVFVYDMDGSGNTEMYMLL